MRREGVGAGTSLDTLIVITFNPFCEFWANMYCHMEKFLLK